MSEQGEPLPQPHRTVNTPEVEIVEEGGGEESSANGVLHTRREIFVGLLPHPEHFAEYERVLPGAADRILRMAEEEGAGASLVGLFIWRQRLQQREQTGDQQREE